MVFCAISDVFAKLSAIAVLRVEHIRFVFIHSFLSIFGLSDVELPACSADHQVNDIYTVACKFACVSPYILSVLAEADLLACFNKLVLTVNARGAGKEAHFPPWGCGNC